MAFVSTDAGSTAYQNQYQTNDNSVAGHIWNYFTQAGLSPQATAGIMGNLAQESSLNPNESGGYLAQWGGDRLTNLQKFANDQNQPITDLDTQLGFVLHELPSYVDVNKLNNMSPSQAALTISDNYEKPAFWAANNTRRENLANTYFQEFTNNASAGDAPQGTESSSNGGGSNTSNTSNKYTGVSGIWNSFAQWENPKGGVGGFISGGMTTDITTYLHRAPFILLGLGIIMIAIFGIMSKNVSQIIGGSSGGEEASTGDDSPISNIAPPKSSTGAGNVIRRGGANPAAIVAENPELLALA